MILMGSTFLYSVLHFCILILLFWQRFPHIHIILNGPLSILKLFTVLCFAQVQYHYIGNKLHINSKFAFSYFSSTVQITNIQWTPTSPERQISTSVKLAQPSPSKNCPTTTKTKQREQCRPDVPDHPRGHRCRPSFRFRTRTRRSSAANACPLCASCGSCLHAFSPTWLWWRWWLPTAFWAPSRSNTWKPKMSGT